MSTEAYKRTYGSLGSRVFSGSSTPVLHHVCMFVPDMDASVAFYADGLGLSVRETFDDIIGIRRGAGFPFRVASVFLQAGDGRYIELHPAGDAPMAEPGFPMNHLAIGVADVDAAYERALSAGGRPYGFTLESEYWDGTPLDVIMAGARSEPMRMAFLQAPSGELVELYASL